MSENVPDEPRPTPRVTSGLLAPTAAFWAASGVTLLGGLVRGKVFAETLGTHGVGVTAQLSNLVTLVGGLAALGLGNAGVKLISEARAYGNEDRRRSLVALIVVLPFLLSLVLLLSAIAMRDQIALTFLADRKYSGFVVLASVSIPLNLLIGSTQVVLQAHGRLLRLAMDSVLIAVLTTATATALVLPYGLHGAAVGIAVTSAVGLAVMLFREPWIARDCLRRKSPSPGDVKEFAALGSASLVATLATGAADAAVRSAVVHMRGIAVNGLYQPVYLLSSQIFVQLSSGLAFALLPSLALLLAVKDRAAVNALLIRAVRLILLICTPLVLLTVGLAPVLVRVFFSSEFDASVPVLDVQLLGEVPRALAYTVGATLLPSGLVRSWLALGITVSVVRLCVAFALLPFYGLQALAFSYLAEWVVAIAIVIVVAERRIGGTGLTSRNRRLAGASALVTSVAVAAARYGPQGMGPISVGITLLAWVVWAPLPEDRAKLRALLAGARLASWRAN